MDAFVSYLRAHWIKTVVSIGIGLTAMLTCLGLQGGWTSQSSYCDACFVAAAILLGIGALAVINNFGGFDLFSYYIRRHRTEEGPEDFGSFVVRKGEERVKSRWAFLPYITIGVCFLIPSIVLMALR